MRDPPSRMEPHECEDSPGKHGSDEHGISALSRRDAISTRRSDTPSPAEAYKPTSVAQPEPWLVSRLACLACLACFACLACLACLACFAWLACFLETAFAPVCLASRAREERQKEGHDDQERQHPCTHVAVLLKGERALKGRGCRGERGEGV